MPRRQIRRSGEAAPSPNCASVHAAPMTGGAASIEIAASPVRPRFDAGSESACSQSPSATSLLPAAPVLGRQAGARSPEPPSAATASAEADVDISEGSRAPKPAPLDGDLIRRRWRSLIGRHPPKTMSHALMDRILAWREQVAQVGDISPRSRAILAAALAGKAAGTGKDGQVQTRDDKSDHDPRRHRPHTPICVGTLCFASMPACCIASRSSPRVSSGRGEHTPASPPSPAPLPACDGTDAASSASTAAQNMQARVKSAHGAATHGLPRASRT